METPAKTKILNKLIDKTEIKNLLDCLDDAEKAKVSNVINFTTIELNNLKEGDNDNFFKIITTLDTILYVCYTKTKTRHSGNEDLQNELINNINNLDFKTPDGFFSLYKYLTEIKYIDLDIKSGFSFNGTMLNDVLKKIQENPNVLFFSKYQAFRLIDIYLEFKILNNLIYHFLSFYSHTKKRKTSYINYIFNKAISFEKKGKDKFKNIESYSKHLAESQTFLSLKKIIEKQLNSLSIKYPEINKNEIKKITIDGVFDNIRIVEKAIFPCLYNLILLKKEREENKVKINSVRNILFDIFPLIKPEERFYSKSRFSYNTNYKSYYLYRVRTIERIIDK